MSDIFAASVGEATEFYLEGGETPVLDRHTGDYYIPSTMEAAQLMVAVLEPADQEALVNHALGAGILKAHDLRLDEPVRSLDELRSAMAVYAIHKTMRDNPLVEARHDSNVRMLQAAQEL